MKLRPALLALCGLLAAVAMLPEPVTAQERTQRRTPRVAAVPAKPKVPMLAVVGLSEQQITVYDSTGARMLESPVSSGSTGYETPPGIFSVVQKNPEHHSNLYDDASMPFMQRLTWTGIALHAGELPGYPASHGCVRLPYSFAERLFDLTNIGMRVVVAREGIAPARVAEPQMFKRAADAAIASGAETRQVQLVSARAEAAPTGRETLLERLQARVADRGRAATEASKQARDLRAAAARAKSAVAPAERAVRQAEAGLAKLEAELASAEKVIESGAPPKRLEQAEATRAAAPERIEKARVQLDKVQADLAAKRDAARSTEDQANAAAVAHAQALQAVEEAKQGMAPVSVFVSRRTQRIYIRKGFDPVAEGPLVIRDAAKPIGTFVFTANEPAEGSQELRWSVVSLYKNPTAIEPPAAKPKKGKKGAANVELAVADVASAEAALARLVIPAELTDRISEIVLPGSSLIISDEPPHLETGKDTDFVVIMPGEPQGGITIRKKPEPVQRPMSYSSDPYMRRPQRSQPYQGGGGFFWFN